MSVVTRTYPLTSLRCSCNTRACASQAIYAANVAKIEKHNAEAAQGMHTWTQGVNKFTDLMPAEFTVRVNARSSPRCQYCAQVPYIPHARAASRMSGRYPCCAR